MRKRRTDNPVQRTHRYSDETDRLIDALAMQLAITRSEVVERAVVMLAKRTGMRTLKEKT